MDEGIGYRHDLILHLIDQAATSPVVVRRRWPSPMSKLFTGKTFESLKDDAESSFDMGSLFSIDQNMMARAFNVDNAAIESAMASAMSFGAAQASTRVSMFADIPVPDFQRSGHRPVRWGSLRKPGGGLSRRPGADETAESSWASVEYVSHQYHQSQPSNT